MKILPCRFSIISTGGTASSLEASGVNVTKVEEITHFPEMVKPNSF
jgi:phosphoribosylaminoimidazolecarboxamide formyltransferase/IMP cyclohydrolase